MKQLRGIDLKRARLVPSSVFASPDEVVRATGLSLTQKLAILRRWEFDVRNVNRLAGGVEAPAGSAMLHRVQRALDGLAGRTSRVPVVFSELAAPAKPRPAYAARKGESGESPRAAPGGALQSGTRSDSRI